LWYKRNSWKIRIIHKLDNYKFIGIIGYSIVLHVYDINTKQHFAMKILQFEDYKQNKGLELVNKLIRSSNNAINI